MGGQVVLNSHPDAVAPIHAETALEPLQLGHSRSRDRREKPLIERIQAQFELEGSGPEEWELDACWVTPWR